MRKLLLPLAALGVWWWMRPSAPGQLEAPAEEVKLVALSGEPLEAAMAEGRCGEMLDELMSRPNWTLGVTTAGADCFGWNSEKTYEIHADGTVVYASNGLTRTILLDSYEQGVLRDLGRLDCVTPVDRDRRSMWIVPGTPALEAGASIVSESVFGMTLASILDRAVERRHTQRLLELAPIELHVRADKYRLELDGGTLRVRRGGRLVEERELWRDELVDLVDHVVTSPPPNPGRGDEHARGTLTAGGVAHPVRFGSYPGGVFAPLWRALDDAAYRE